MYSHLKSGGAAKEHHCVKNWPSKGVEVRTCSFFKNNLILKLSVLLHRENWAVKSNSSSTSCQTVVFIKFSHSIRVPRENLGEATLFTHFMLINWPVFYWQARALLSRRFQVVASANSKLNKLPASTAVFS